MYSRARTAAKPGSQRTPVCSSPLVRALAIDVETPSTLYAGTMFGGEYKSTNGGESWSEANIGLTNTNIGSLVIDPATPDILYAGACMLTVYSGARTVAKAGVRPVRACPSDGWLGALAIDPVTPTIVYAGISDDVYKSMNGGDDWVEASSGLPTHDPVVKEVTALAIDPEMLSTLYAGTLGAGVYKSRNGGGNWSAANTGLLGTVYALAIDPVSGTLYAGTGSGVFKSTNGGENWVASLLACPRLLTSSPWQLIRLRRRPSTPAGTRWRVQKH